jgi:tripartite-type tricarboxylate transporter receptor subunit TctC
VNIVLQKPEVANKLSSLGLYPIGGSPDVLAQLLKTDSERWASVIRDANIKED